MSVDWPRTLMVQFRVRVSEDEAQEIRDRYEVYVTAAAPARLSLNDFLSFLLEAGMESTEPNPPTLEQCILEIITGETPDASDS